MKAKLVILFFVLNTANLRAQETWTDQYRVLPDELRGLQTSMFITHSPNPVYPELNMDTLSYPGKYIWKHSTSVVTKIPNLTVVKAGSFIWLAKKGWFRNIEMDQEDFSKYFDCKDGKLQPSLIYTFLENYRHGDELYAGDAIWYVLAKDENGILSKGVSIVETEQELKVGLKSTDFSDLVSKNWVGTLSYLDYGTQDLVKIPTELIVLPSLTIKGAYTWITKYPKEPSHNSKDTIIISKDGSDVDGEMVKSRSILADGTLKFLTEKPGNDNNKKAVFRFTYLIGKKQFIRKKEVRYLGENNWFTRNELNLKSN